MEKLHILSSGSKANSLVLESNDKMILIDQGLSFKEFSKRADELGIETTKIVAILLTHEHSDHISGIPYTAFKLNIPVFSTQKSLAYLQKISKYDLQYKIIEKNLPFKVSCFECIPFETMHDALDPVGFFISFNCGESLSIATDTGKITNQMMSYISHSDHIVLEANHDVDMLYQNSKYPPELKERIHGPYGHLSNDQTLEIIDKMSGKRPKTVIFSHLSEENNSPQILNSMLADFKQKRSLFFKVFIARQNAPFSVLLHDN